MPASQNAGVTVSTSALTVPEGGSQTYTVVLDAPPNSNVRIRPTIASGDTDLSVTPGVATFGASDWSTPRTFTVSAAQDDDADDGVATIAHVVSSSDPSYDSSYSNADVTPVSVASVTATEQDDDTHGIIISPTTLSVPEGGSRTYTVVLKTPAERAGLGGHVLCRGTRT